MPFPSTRTRASSQAIGRPLTALAGALMAVLMVALTGCVVGPDYARVPVDAPEAYKEDTGWKPARPQAVDEHQVWWMRYADPVLDGLMQDALHANQNLRVAESQYRQAQAIAAQARSALWPGVNAGAGASRSRSNTGASRLADVFNTGLSASWQPDLWGGIRRSVEAGDASAEASADDLAAVRLSIQAAVAQNYLQLRIVDVQRDLYADTVEAYTRSFKLTQSQYAVGTALRSDVALAQSQLRNAQAQGVDLEAARTQLEHAIATLTGVPPARFALPPIQTTVGALQQRLPTVPAGLPSALLERRPDIAAAERRVAVANANIGVARSAFFPAVTLSASGGFNAVDAGSLFNAPSRVWSLGASLAQTVFDGGLRRARSDQTVAAYDGAVAQYRQTVLVGFQQVEDNLAALRLLDQESKLLDEASQAARLAERSVLSQYRAGTATYFSVVTAQTLALNNERSLTQVVGRQLAASVSLAIATGGGWQATQPLAAAATAQPSAPALVALPASSTLSASWAAPWVPSAERTSLPTP